MRNSELARDIRTDFVTARTDSRTDGSENIPRLGSEIVAQARERRPNDVSGGASPPRMNRSHGSRRAIDQENRKTVRRANRDSDAGRLCDERVTFPDTSRPRRNQDNIGVDLRQACHPSLIRIRFSRAEAVLNSAQARE